MTHSEDKQTPTERAASDLAYVRDAIERQQRFVGERLPPWFAAVTGIYLAGSAGMRDFVGPDMARYAVLGGAFLLATIYAAFVARATKGVSKCAERGNTWRMFVPWMGIFVGFALLGIAKAPLELSVDQLRVIFLAIFATGAITIGNLGFRIMQGMGIGAIGAILGFLFVPAYAGLVAGTSLGLGLYLGALVDHRSQAG